jgi:adenine-specific DNA-methyltransferase
MPRRKSNNSSDSPTGSDSVAAYRHPSKRKNIPPSGLAAQGEIREAPKIRYEYNPHLPPVLRSGPAETDQLPELLERACREPLTRGDAKLLAEALRRHEPWLEWSGKREKPWFEVDPVALHIHERVSTQAILRVLAREDVQRDLFADPKQDYAEAVQFYQHDVDWSNRMILGDSLQVMASLARREDLAGRVQMIYVDPPYGIKFASNFQPQLGQRDVKDREQDLTREPEMVRAYRDTWTLGIHSYLAYLRDRLAMARELLADTGSIFVQISDENLHRLRCVMDEVFGAKNFISQITVKKTTGSTADFIPGSCDYLLWYAKNREVTKFQQLFEEKRPGDAGATGYSKVELKNGERRILSTEEFANPDLLPSGGAVFAGDNITSQSLGRDKGEGAASWFKIDVEGREFTPGPKARWKTNEEGMRRLLLAERLIGGDRTTLSYKRKLADFPVTPFSNIWTDTVGQNQLGGEKIYVVQTALKIVERCLLMTTDPGDLVLDPTCGSGTTAYAAEDWGRRWITVDSSRVALALAKQRLMTARLPYYQLRELSAVDLQRNSNAIWLTDPTGQLAGKCTLACKQVPHVTLKSIARNMSLDPIFAKHEQVLSARLQELNAALKQLTPEIRRTLITKLNQKQKTEGKRAVSEADRRRWQLPETAWTEWEVPFDTDPDWPAALGSALNSYRKAWRAKMDEVNDCIAKNAEMEELVDTPETINNIVRVAGPFTMEGVIALEDGPDTPIGGAPEGQMETFEGETQSANAEAHLDKMVRLLKAAGVDFKGNKNMNFTRLEAMSGASLLHAEGEWVNGESKERRVAVSIGPEVGNISAYQVEEAVRSANRRGYDDLIFAGFGFDASAQAAIEDSSHPNLRCHMALIRPDVAMDDLLKTQPGSQIFNVFSAPRVKPPVQEIEGQYVIEVEGMDVYDPVSNTLYPTDKQRIAAWFLDSDYDGRTFCICQAFFPDKTKWQKLAKALGAVGVIDEDQFEALSGLRSLPFPRPSHLKAGEEWKIAVKVIDPRGNEGMRVMTL